MVQNWSPSRLEWVANVVTFLNPRFTLPVWFLNELDSLFSFKKNQCDKNGHNVNGQFYKNSFGSELPLLCTLQQSLDYDTSENTLYFKEQKSYSAEVRTDSAVWLRIVV